MRENTRIVFYSVPAGEAFYDLIRGEMPAGYRLLAPDSNMPEERAGMLAQAEIVIVGGRLFDGAEMALAPRLRLLLHQGVGYHDTVDVAAAAARGLRLALTPEGTSEGVAENAIMLMLAAGRRLAFVDSELRAGRWHSNTFRSSARQLLGSTVGIVGLGRIGKEVARRLIGFGTRTLYTDIVDIPAGVEAELKVERVSFETLLQRSDFVTLHVPLTGDTRHMIDAAALALMPAGSVLVNCARGPVVAEGDLVAALDSGHLGGAGLDTFEIEPPPHPVAFARFANVVMTPHNSPGTSDTMRLKFRKLFENAERFYRGEAMRNEVALNEAAPGLPG